MGPRAKSHRRRNHLGRLQTRVAYGHPPGHLLRYLIEGTLAEGIAVEQGGFAGIEAYAEVGAFGADLGDELGSGQGAGVKLLAMQVTWQK